jgi:hypothetical protein
MCSECEKETIGDDFLCPECRGIPVGSAGTPVIPWLYKLGIEVNRRLPR